MELSNDFVFTSKIPDGQKRFKQDIAILCHCGEATKTHSIKQLRSCRNEKNAA